MCIDQSFVYPVARGFGKLGVVNLARGHHGLPHLTRYGVAVNIDILKVVVSANCLYLLESVLQSFPVPEPDVFQSSRDY